MATSSAESPSHTSPANSPFHKSQEISASIVSPSDIPSAPIKTLSPSFYISWRMAITLAVFMAVTMHSVMRSILGMTMVCMVNATAIVVPTYNDSLEIFRPILYSEECEISSSVKEEYDGEFVWTVKQQSYIFAAMAWGQLVSALPAGLYADKYSARKLLFFAVFIAAVLTLLTPLAAHWGYGALIAVRACLGLTGGILWPCVNALVARWSPISERSTLYGIITGGNQVSIIFLMPISAAMCRQKNFLNGWPSTYYVTGTISIIWAVIWLFISSDDPFEHKRISKDELIYIADGRSTTCDKENRKRLKLPFKEVLFSPASLAIVACLTSAAWGILCLLTYLPTYLRDVLLLNLSKNGDFSALPFFSQFVFKIIFARVADVLKKHTKCSQQFIMKGFNTFGMFSLAGFMFGATFLNCTHANLAIALLCIGTALYSAVTPGFLASMVIIAPKYAGFVAAWTNFIACLSGIVLPYIVGAVVVQSTAAEWRIVIGIGSLAQIVSAIIFIIWGSAEEEEWAKSPYLHYDEKSESADKKLADKLIT